MVSLGNRSISAVFWGAGGAVLRMVLQLVTQVALARLLGPNEYGVFAIGAIVIGFSGFFSDIGLAYGLIQKRELCDRDIRFVFTWQILLGCLVSTLIAFGAVPISKFFGEVKSAEVVRALSVLCLINALSAPAMNLLKRKLDFKTLQLAFLISYVVGYVLVGFPLALAGYGVWSLVFAWISQSSVNGLWLYFSTMHPLRPLFWYEEAAVQSKYGGTVLGTNLLNWIISNIDRIIIGKLLPSQILGLYTVSYNLVYNPTSSVLGVLQPVFFSTSARIAHEDERGRIGQGFVGLVSGISVFFLPVFVVVSAISKTFILTLYGPQWTAASPVFSPLALAMPFFLIWGMSTPLLWASGNASREFTTQWPLALAWGVACWLLASVGAVAVAWGVLGLMMLRCVLTARVAHRLLLLSPSNTWQALRGGLMLSVIVAGPVWCLDELLSHWFVLPVLRLLLDVSLGFAVWVCTLRLLPWLIGPELAELLNRTFKNIPAVLAVRLAWLTGLRAKN